MKRSSSWTASDLKQIIFMRTSPKGGGGGGYFLIKG